jgi:hypothetical protein
MSENAPVIRTKENWDAASEDDKLYAIYQSFGGLMNSLYLTSQNISRIRDRLDLIEKSLRLEEEKDQ